MHSFVDIQSGKAYNGCMDMPKKEDVIMADKVLAGEYTGAEIKVSANGQSAYVLAPGEQAHYINKLNVESVSEVNRTSSNDVASAFVGQALIGNAGLLLGSNQKEIMLEIHWKDGTKSLVTVGNNAHQAIIIGMYNDTTQAQQDKTATQDASARKTGTIITIAIVIICTLIYLIPTT
jgi:hypothetical protein